MKDLESVRDVLNKRFNLDENEKELISFIKLAESDIYSGKDEDGNSIVVGIQKDVGFKISTCQSNGWIRINNYEIVEDDEGNSYIQASETYER